MAARTALERLGQCGTEAGQPSEPGGGKEEQEKALRSQSVRRDVAQQVLPRNKL